MGSDTGAGVNRKGHATVSRDLNRVQLIGHVGGDPEARQLDSGTVVTTFSVATNRSWKDARGQVQTETEWSRVVAWGRLAEIAGEYLRKGRQVYIEGRLRTRQWQDQDGQTRYTTEVVAENLILLDSRPQAGATAAPPEAASPEPARQNAASVRPTHPAQRQPKEAPHRPPRGIHSQPSSEQSPSGDQADDEKLSF
jgi:single-strand DNA-binding protein